MTTFRPLNGKTAFQVWQDDPEALARGWSYAEWASAMNDREIVYQWNVYDTPRSGGRAQSPPPC